MIVKPENCGEGFFGCGHSKADKAANHDRIVQESAAARFREAGVDGIGVADLMKDAGLTHGSFYRHFASRDDLATEAIERALREGSRAVFAAVATIKLNRQSLLNALVDAYLSTARTATTTGDKLCRHDVGGRCRPQQRPGAVRVYAAGRRVPGAAHSANRGRQAEIEADEGNRRVVHAGRCRVDGPRGERRQAVARNPQVGRRRIEGPTRMMSLLDKALSRPRFLLVDRAGRPSAHTSKINNLRVRQSDKN